MARVVQRRSSTPYLLIIMTFLFLVVTIFAVLFWTSQDKANAEAAKAKADLSKFVNSTDMQDPEYQKALDDLANDTKNPNFKGGTTLYSRMKKQIGDLAYVIDIGSDHKYAAAMDAADSAQKVMPVVDRSSLKATISKLAGQIALERSKNADLTQTKAEAEKKLADAISNRDLLAKDYQIKLAAYIKQVTDADAKASTATKDYQEAITRLKAEEDKRYSDLQTALNQNIQKLTDMDKDSQAKTVRIHELETINGEKVGTGKNSTIQADGKIVKVADSEGICYVNLGSNDKVLPGLTMSVYSAKAVLNATPDSKDEAKSKPKAKIVVSNIFENTSECRIVEQDSKDPIIPGDVVSNVAYDAARNIMFVVDGLFDLSGGNQPSLQGAENVRDLIKRFGGKVATEVNYNVDYVVLGDAPPTPGKLPADANATTEKLYREQMKASEHYKALIEQAKSMRIPVLNANRFMALVGYSMPTSK